MSLFSKHESEQGKTRRSHGCLWSIIIALVAYLVLCVVMGTMMEDMLSPTAHLDENTVYQLKMEGTVVEQGQEENPFDAFMSEMPFGGGNAQTVGLDNLKSNIQLPREDERIKGIVLRGGEMNMSPATAKALRDALLEYKQSGKFLIAYAESYDQLNYYVASVADRIYLNATGVVVWNGLTAQKLYFKRLLEKVGVEMQIVKVGTFKSAVEPFTNTAMSDADREQSLRYINGIWEEMRQAVSVSRGLSEDSLDVMANRCMMLQPEEELVRSGLVDTLVYQEDINGILESLTGTDDYKTISTSSLAKVKRTKHEADSKIAVVYAEGEITDDGTEGIVGKKMVKLLSEIGEEDDVKAVVLRVNSPGGSASASEHIWHAITVLQQKGLPVVVSMGDYAASGGYYISCAADYIYAEPTTLTGSIGIFGMIPSFAGIRDKVGLDIDGVSTHDHAAIHVNMTYRGMNDQERALMQNMVSRGYDLFTRRCADGRHLTQDSIKSIAEGRVWLGKDALNLGLVDAMGNMENAITKAADLANLTDYEITYYPEKKDFMTTFLESLDQTTEEERLYLRVKSFCSQPRILTLMDIVDIE